MNQTILTRRGKDLLYDLGGALFYAISIDTFAKNANFAPGGVSGLALIANYLWDLPVGMLSLIMNLPLILLSYRFVGKRFLIKTMISVTICTVVLDYVFPFFPSYEGDPFLAAIYTGLSFGVSQAMFYMRGSSTGGTDLLIMSIKVLRPHLSLGAVTMALDFFIILLGWPVFGNVDAVLYGLVSTGICSLVIDQIMYGMGAGKVVMIITKKGQEISDEISRQAGRGTTILQATGGYTGDTLQVLMCACAKAEAFRVRSCAHEVDENSFVMIADTSEVYGEGFANPKSTAGIMTSGEET